MSPSGKDKLLIHASGPRWSWMLVDRRGKISRRGQCDADQPDWPTGLATIALVDSAACIGIKVDLPEMPAARLQQALRWAAEEHLASSAEDEHVVAGPRDDDGLLSCVVIGRERMAELLARFGSGTVEVMVPDALCLPWQPGQVSLAAAGDRILARWDSWAFGSFEPELLGDMLDSLMPGEAERVWYGPDVPAVLLDSNPRQVTGDALEAMAPAALAAPVNLLAGPWAPSSTLAARNHWRWAAGLAAVAVALALIVAGVEHQQLKRQANDLQVAIDAQFHQAFPDVGRVVRHREQAERELARLRFGESAGLLDLLNRAAPVIDAQEQVQLDGLNYREGVLELSLRAPDVAILDQFEQRLRALDLRAELQSASLGTDGASGRMRISEGMR
jgi:general secretion pathway protein L